MPKRILIADDALELGRLLQTVLMTYDSSLSIQVVPSAEEALLESSRKPLDLLIADIRLPGMSGFDLVRKIRARHPNVRVIFITGWSEPALEERSREMNVDGFFRKPLDMTVFVETARRCLGMSSTADIAAPRTRKRTGSLAGKLPSDALPSETLAEAITSLRQRLGAEAVFVLDEVGRMLAQAGDIPALALEKDWVGPVMSLLNDAEKVSRLVGDGAAGRVMVFAGTQYHFLLAPAGDHAILIFLRPGRSSLRLALALEEALEGQRGLAAILAKMSARQPASAEASTRLPVTSPLPPIESTPPLPTSKPENQPGLEELEALLAQPSSGLKDKDVDAFWDNLSASEQPAPANPDVITYDQARKLGLAPEDSK